MIGPNHDYVTGFIAKAIMKGTDGDPAAALVMIAEIAAEICKLADQPTVTREHFVVALDRFLTVPTNRFLESPADEPRKH